MATWASLASNETFTFTEAQGSGIGVKETIPTSNEAMSKNDCITYMNNDTSVPSFAALAGNELVTKADMAGFTFGNSGTLYFFEYNGACVAPDTLINIKPDVCIKASDIMAGDMVYTYHDKLRVFGQYKVLHKRTSIKETVSIVTAEGVLTTSLSHKLMVNGVWGTSGDIKIGDRLRKGNRNVRVDHLIYNKPEEVVELSIEDAQTYITNGFLSHNKIAFIDGWASGSTACSSYGANAITAYWTGTIGNGTKLYSSTSGNFLKAHNTTKYFYMGGHSFTSSVDYTSSNSFTIANYTACSVTYTMTWNIYNPSANPNAEAIIKINGSTVVSTQAPDSNSTFFTSGDSIEASVSILGSSGQVQSIDVTGGASYSNSNSDVSFSSGLLYPTGNVTITIYLS